MDKDIKELLENMAANLGTTSENLFAKLVKQAKVNAIVSVLQFLFILVIGAVITKYIIWQVGIGVANYDQVEKYLLPYIILSFFDLTIFLTYFFSCFDRVYYIIDEGLKCWLSPEGYVINEILDRLN
jgi:hypothetical protein